MNCERKVFGKRVMNPIPLIAIITLGVAIASPSRAADGAVASREVKPATYESTAYEDDLTQIKRNNKMAPDRPAAQQAIVTSVGGRCKLLFLGDSNTQFWENNQFKRIWDYYFADRNAVNLGIGGDTINDIRSRLRDTNWGDCSPPVTVVLAGTNDRGDSPEKRANKLKLLVNEVFSHFPQTKVMLVSIPPCGLNEHDALTTSYQATDKILQTYADGRRIFYIDLAQTMTWEEGLGFSGIGLDRLHLQELGRLRWAELMEPVIAKILNEKSKDPLPHPQLPEYMGAPDAPKILIAGDGIAFLGEFRTNLQYQLRDRGFKYHLVGPYADPQTPADSQGLHFAIYQADMEVLKKIIPPVTAQYAPDILVLCAGFGEINYGRTKTEDLNSSIALRVGKIIDDIGTRSPSTQIILCLITPNSAPEKNATIIAANNMLLELLEIRVFAGKPILFADCYSVIDSDSTSLSQGYLPVKASLLRAAASVSPSIEAILNKSVEQRPLPSPGHVTVTSSDSVTQIAWQAVPGATRYNVKRSIKEGGPYAIIGTGLTNTSFADSNIRKDSAYYYVVSAADARGQGADSAEVKVASN